MSDNCAINGCSDDALWWVYKEVEGEALCIPFCQDHQGVLHD